MNRKLQFAGWLIGLGLGVVMAFPAAAQNRPPKPKPEQHQEQRREQRQAPRQERQQERRNERNQGNPNRPPASQGSASQNANRSPERARNEQNRPPSNAPAARNFNNLNPQQQQRTLDNYRKYQNLPPAQRLQMQEAAQNWNRLSPEQKNHIKADVLPRWQQLPSQRQRAIQQRLGVLKNMPESARNQHLADPNFTRGMSEDDKSMLRDLSHLHVGGAPEAPHE